MKRHAAPVLALIAISFALYANAFRNEFAWDDDIFIVNAKEIRSVNLPRFFSEGSADLYRPLRTALYALTYRFGGLDPLNYHIVGKTMNALTVAILYGLLLLLFENRGGAFWGALLFAVHPVHTEKVAFITSTYDIPADLLWLAAFALYVLHRKRRPPFALTVSVLLFAAGLLFGENAAVLPLTVVLYDMTFGDGDKKPARWIPYFAVLAVYLAVRTSVLGAVAREGGHTLNPDMFGNFLTMSGVTFAYFKLLLWPWPLIPTYEVKQAVFPYPPHLYAAAIAVAALLAAAWLQRRGRPWVTFTVFWFFAVISPNLNFIPTGNLMAERYLYLPSAILSFSVAAAYAALEADRKKKAALLAALLAVMAVFSVLVVRRNPDWRSDTPLWSKTLMVKPDSYVALMNLAVEAWKNGHWKTTEKLLKYAAAVKPEKTEAFERLTEMYLEGKAGDPLPMLEKAYSKDKKDVCLLGIAQIKISRKEYAAAGAMVDGLLKRNPSSRKAWSVYGDLLYSQKKEGWAGAYVRAYALSGRDPAILVRMATAWSLAGKPAAALRIARIGLQEHPDNKPLLELAAKLEAENPGEMGDNGGTRSGNK
ncbi:MAG: glycosyltransferase family 39 protein [Nitrospinae bacterium]|nr:glycosyltransferase family 39 protein [Nitrospinota bacterium]